MFFEDEENFLMEFSSGIKLGFPDENERINYSTNVYFIFRELSYEESQELYVVMLNAFQELIKISKVDIENHDIASVDKKKIFQSLFQWDSDKFILVHAHPLGSPSYPSEEEIKFTKEIKNLSYSLGFILEDHLVIGKDGFFSYRDRQALW